MNTVRPPDLGAAMRHMRQGNLAEATAAIQRELSIQAPSAAGQFEEAPSNVIEGDFRRVDKSESALSRGPLPQHVRDYASTTQQFTQAVFSSAEGSRAYKLYTPRQSSDSERPLIVMLHGCTQSPDDFATGTRMNALAEEQGFLVAYPAQDSRVNTNKCWNWFAPSHQGRDHGEPAIIAGLIASLRNCHRIDANRIYVAGLSAGAAMAVVLANTHPDVFAAIGVHSGLPYRSASDVASAFKAMQGIAASGTIPSLNGSNDISPRAVPAIVFHGDQDQTVKPINGELVARATAGDAVSADNAGGSCAATVELNRGVVGQRQYERRCYRNQHGVVTTEHWLVKGAGHAWFGGDMSGTFVDSAGPDASREMVRFFMQHPHKDKQNG